MDDTCDNSESNNNIDNESNKRRKLVHSSFDPSSNDAKASMATIVRNKDLLPFKILPFLDVVSLVDKKPVSVEWNENCSYAIDAKATTRKAFEDGNELKEAVRKYIRADRNDLEDVAETYGYPIDKWDVSKVTDFSHLFQDCKQFNEDIGSWNTSNATNMSCMLCLATAFNKDISRWDVSKVRDMSEMFAFAETFNGNLATWDTSNVMDMSKMFWYATAYNQDLSNWNVSCVRNMRGMFYQAKAFDCNVSAWNTSNVMDIYVMFDGATSFDRDSVTNWDLSRARHRRFMFG